MQMTRKKLGEQVISKMAAQGPAAAVDTTPGHWKVRKWAQDGVMDGFTYMITDSRGHGMFQAMQHGEHERTLQNMVAASFTPELLEAAKLLRAFAGMYTGRGVPNDVLGQYDGLLDAGPESVAAFVDNLLRRIAVETRLAQERGAE